MFIHKRHEGEKYHFGLNWMSNEMTFLSLVLVIPVWITKRKNYNDFSTDNFYFGHRILTSYFRLRIRRWYKFSPHIRKILFTFSSDLRPIGKQKFICTREMIEDGLCNEPCLV